ncbi:MAG TPA: gliding motility-associated C-terminal domain-containing protein, partial [Ferruginibacter sp.]|nr:gliding motility-associated C-terminal domain-containing protein [Ferruginibacter sp.]
TRKIVVQLSSPIQKGGSYAITLKRGVDSNTLLDECSQETPVGSTIPFTIKDTVNAGFAFNILYDCKVNTVQYQHNGSNGVNSWAWTFENQPINNLQNPIITYQDFSPTQTQLVVSNGVCSDTLLKDIFFDNLLVGDFESTSIVCPGDKAVIIEKSLGNIISWAWNFGNGNTSSLKDPPDQVYAVTNITHDLPIRLIVRNSFGCADSITRMIKVINNCFIAVPSAFTPNGDGLNDYLYPLNAYKAKDLNFSVYNRFGQRLFHTSDWTNKWDGRYNGQGADPATYVWVLTYTNSDTNKRVEQKGTVILIR